ncbi:unnamed protein product [Ambrosiozyma monospora]|uniref:Unnamed protein product n=1 Tax=Ambrosiozyma monospora TaxID=43982 RepID=A0ACB5STL5_AMBMO|nr:unnamed protein product [Ambrosiozyma monospora]
MLSQTSLFMLLSSLAVRAAPLADAAPEADSGLASLYYQCGGTNWTGATQCVDGATCYSQNDYYHQCIATENVPNAASAATTATTTAAEAGSSADFGVTSAKIAIQTTSQEEFSDDGSSAAPITSTATFQTTFEPAETSSSAQTVGHNVENSSSSTSEETTSTQAAQQTSSTETVAPTTSSTAPVQETSSTAAAVQATSLANCLWWFQWYR